MVSIRTDAFSLYLKNVDLFNQMCTWIFSGTKYLIFEFRTMRTRALGAHRKNVSGPYRSGVGHLGILKRPGLEPFLWIPEFSKEA